MYTTFVGIDPGKLGAICSIHLLQDGRQECWKMKDSVSEMLGSLSKYKRDAISTFSSIVVLEKVHSMPKQGVASSFSFGREYGKLEMALTALKLPFTEVTPQCWMKALGIVPRKKVGYAEELKKEFKQRILKFARKLFPESEVTLQTADALLIAEYCRRIHSQNSR